MKSFFVFSTLLLMWNSLPQCTANEFERNISFFFYNKRNDVITKTNVTSAIPSTCNPFEPVSIIVHGYTESCAMPWVPDLVQNLNTFRGGCVVCMDYSFYASNPSYAVLVGQFANITQVLTTKLRQFQRSYYSLSQQFFLFGFSFGGQIVLQAGRNVGPKLIQKIDACEPAGPGFDTNAAYQQLLATDSAQDVQCVHTSNAFGTIMRNCHQDWLMGNCGLNQTAASDPPFGSHGLCPYMYNFAFRNKFFAIDRPSFCQENSRDVKLHHGLPAMGYKPFSFFGPTQGVYYANTFSHAPYNIDTSRFLNTTRPF